MGLNRPKLNLKLAYERVKSALHGITQNISELYPIAKNSASNGIYNGKMTISQRGDFTSPTAVTHAIYYLDRWEQLNGTSSSEVSVAEVTLPTGEIVNAQKTTCTSDGDYIDVAQQVEAMDALRSKTVTVSAWVRSNTPDAALVHQSNGINDKTNHSGNGEWELLSATYNLADTLTYFYIDFYMLTPVTGDYIEFTDVRLDLGSHRLSGDREYGQELALCQRYYFTLSQGLSGIAKSTSDAVLDSLFPVVMRSTPTVTLLDTTVTIRHNAGNTFTAVSGTLFDVQVNKEGFLGVFSGFAAALTTGKHIFLLNGSTPAISFNAEL